MDASGGHWTPFSYKQEFIDFFFYDVSVNKIKLPKWVYQWLRKWELWILHNRNTEIFARSPDGSHYWSTIINLAEIDKVNLQSQRYKSVHKPIMTQEEKDSMITNIE